VVNYVVYIFFLKYFWNSQLNTYDHQIIIKVKVFNVVQYVILWLLTLCNFWPYVEERSCWIMLNILLLLMTCHLTNGVFNICFLFSFTKSFNAGMRLYEVMFYISLKTYDTNWISMSSIAFCSNNNEITIKVTLQSLLLTTYKTPLQCYPTCHSFE